MPSGISSVWLDEVGQEMGHPTCATSQSPLSMTKGFRGSTMQDVQPPHPWESQMLCDEVPISVELLVILEASLCE